MRTVFEAIGAVAEGPGASGAEAQPADGQTFRIRSSSACELWALIGHRATPGRVSIRSPLIHDNVNGIQDDYDAEQRTRIIDPGQPFRSQDEYKVTMTGDPAMGFFEQNVLYFRYTDVPGLGGKFLNLKQLREQAMAVMTQRVDVPLVNGTAWEGDVAIDATDDQLKANSQYAITGWTVSGADNAVFRIISPDWGNLGIASPHNYVGNRSVTSTMMTLARTGIEAIPVFNSSNKSLVVLSGLSQVTATVSVFVHMVLLK